MPTFTNQATLTYNNTVVRSNIVEGQMLDVLSATKSAVGGSYLPGENITYVISLRNSGTADLTGLTVTDNMGAYDGGAVGTVYPLRYEDNSLLYYNNGNLVTTAPTVNGTAPITFGGITVPANGNAMLIYTAAVTPYADPGAGGTLTNGIEVTGGGLSVPVTASADSLVAEEPILSITKSMEPASVVENGTVTFTFTLQNIGNSPADTGVTVSDTFDPPLNITSVTFNGTDWTGSTNYSYTGNTFTTSPNAVTVDAAAVTRDPDTGLWNVNPGISTLTVTGTV